MFVLLWVARMADAALDNDVLLKGVSYGLLAVLLDSLPGGPYVHGILGTAKFVLPKILVKRPPNRVEQARADLALALSELETLEPDEHETALAAELEFEAQQKSQPLHAGECQLIAILATRRLRHMLTGDRNAIAALAAAAPAAVDVAGLARKFICFEQAILYLMNIQGAQRTRDAICAEREVDTAMRICFSCASPEVAAESWAEGLKSHIEALRNETGELLAL